MAYEDDWIKDQIKVIKVLGFENIRYVGVLDALLKKINNLEQEVKELKNGGKKK